MRYLFFTNTPAHVHMYKHAVSELRQRGHDVLVLGRDYGCTKALLDYYELPYTLYGECGTNKFSLFSELPKHFINIFAEARAFDPDLVCGVGAYAAYTGAVTRSPVFVIHDSEPTTLDHLFSSVFVDAFITPYTFKKDINENHYEFNGFKELAYLHPDVYEPAADIRDELGVAEDEDFVIVRFNAFGSHHDINHDGFSPAQRRQLIEALSEHATVFVSDEGGEIDFELVPGRPFDLPPALLHDALAEASLLIADTQTMVTEAACLGTPAIRSNSFIGDDDMGNFIELEEHGLVRNLADFDDVLEQSREILSDDDIRREWRDKRDAFLGDKDNITDVIVEALTNPDEIDTVSGLSRRNEKAYTRLSKT